jgi:hypothetical protein
LLLNSENRSCNGVTSFQTLEKLEMKLNRKIVKKFNTGEEADEGYVHAEKNELISMIWEITKDNWAFAKGENVKRRLQRDVATIIRRKS